MIRILIIDDQDRTEEMDSLTRRASRKHIEIECEQFNVGSPLESEMVVDRQLNLVKVGEIYQERFGRRRFHLVCFDYRLGPYEKTGVDVLHQLRPLFPKSPEFLFYSSNRNEVIKRILDDYDAQNPQPTEDKLISLVRARAIDFVQRNDFQEKVLEIFADYQETLDDLFKEEMYNKYPGMDFISTYFEGFEVRMDQLLEIENGRGQRAKREFVQQFIAYLANLNDEN